LSPAETKRPRSLCERQIGPFLSGRRAENGSCERPASGKQGLRAVEGRKLMWTGGPSAAEHSDRKRNRTQAMHPSAMTHITQESTGKRPRVDSTTDAKSKRYTYSGGVRRVRRADHLAHRILPATTTRRRHKVVDCSAILRRIGRATRPRSHAPRGNARMDAPRPDAPLRQAEFVVDSPSRGRRASVLAFPRRSVGTRKVVDCSAILRTIGRATRPRSHAPPGNARM